MNNSVKLLGQLQYKKNKMMALAFAGAIFRVFPYIFWGNKNIKGRIMDWYVEV